MGQTFAGLKAEYDSLLASVTLTRPGDAMAAAHKVFANANRYIAAGNATGVPWSLIGALDLRESDCDPRAGLGQGDPWNQVSTHVPRGKGPFKSWAAAAEFYIRYDNLDDVPAPWAMDVACYKAEAWNGWGYRNKGIFTPYLWAGTNHYKRGKYIADGEYSSTAVDEQLGVVAILFQMVTVDPTVYIGADPGTIPLPPSGPAGPVPVTPAPAPFTLKGTMWIQSMLNVLMPKDEPLVRVDGNYGRRTAAAVKSLQIREGLRADGQAGDETLSRMDLLLSQIT